MADTPEHHDAQPDPQDLDLEAQLDKLLADLEETDPESVPADLRQHSDPVDDQPEPETPDEVVAETDAAPEPTEPPDESPEPAVAEADVASQTEPEKQGVDLESIASMASNLLDQQIQNTIESASELIDSGDTEQAPESAKTDDVAAAATTETPTPADASSSATDEPSESGIDALGGQIDSLLKDMLSQDNQPQADEAKAEAVDESPPQPTADVPSAPDETGGAAGVSIEQIDAMLADSAEQAIEQESDQSPVPGTDEILAAQAAEEAKAAEAKAEADSAQAAPEAEVETAAEPETAETESQPAQAFEAGAEDVARELAEDAQASPAETASEPAQTQEPAETVASEPATSQADSSEVFAESAEMPEAEIPADVVINASALKKAEQSMLVICGKINRPLYRLSPEMRDTVGYVGVLTTAIALFLTIYGLLF